MAVEPQVTEQDLQPAGALPAADNSTIVIPSLTDQPTPQNGEAIDQKAHKAHFALGPDSPGVDVLRDTFWADQEKRVRQQAAWRAEVNHRQDMMGLVNSLTARAAAEGRPLTSDEQQTILFSNTQPNIDPDTILEKLYAQRLTTAVSSAQSIDTDSTLGAAMAENPEATHNVMDVNENYIQRSEIAQEVQRKVQQIKDQQSWLGWGVDRAKEIFPGYTWYKTRNLMQKGESLTQGNNMMDQVNRLWLITDPKAFKTALETTLYPLAQDNPALALEIAQAVTGYTSFDQMVGNLGTAADIATAPGARTLTSLIKGGARMTPALERFVNRSAAGAVEASRPTVRAADMLVAAGNTEEAAVQQAGERALRAFDPTAAASQYDIFKEMPGLLDPSTFYRPAGTVANARSARILKGLEDSSAALGRVLTDSPTIPRVVVEDALQKSYQLAETEWKKTYRHIEDAVLDVQPERLSNEAFGGTDKINVYVGHMDATPFEEPEVAKNFAQNVYKLPEGSYEIVPWNGNYAIKASKPVDETAQEVRDLRVTLNNQAPVNMVNWALGALRSPDDVLSPLHNQARKVLTFGGNEAVRYYRQALAPLGKLSKEEHSRLADIMHSNQTDFRTVMNPDGTTSQIQGRYHNTIPEFEQAYQNRFGTLPSEKETQAYFTVRQINDFDYAFRNISMLRDKQRLGAEQKAIVFRAKSNDGPRVEGTITTKYFEGRTVQQLPWESKEPFTVAWIDDKGRSKFTLSSQLFKGQRDQIEKAIANGAQILQPLNGMDDVLQKLIRTGGDKVDFVIAPGVKTKPLSSVQIAYREGGHLVYDDGVYLAQPNVWTSKFGRTLYGGDTTMNHFTLRAEGQKYVKLFNEAREMLLNKVPDAQLKAFVTTKLPFKSLKEFKAQFGKGKLRVDVPFFLTGDGERIADHTDLSRVIGKNYLDLSRDAHSPMVNVNSKYAQERGNLISTIKDVGTQANPVLSFVPAATVNPLDVVARSGNEILRRRFFDDYSHRAVEDWVTQFKEVLDMPINEAIQDPTRALRMAEFRQGADAAAVAAAKNSRRAILHLIGQGREGTSGAWTYLRDKIIQGTYNTIGPKGAEILDQRLWTKTTNPIAMLRGIAFNEVMGFWNPVQFFKQYASMGQVLALDDNVTRVAKSHMLAWMFRAYKMGDFNPGYTTAMGDMARKVLGVSKADFEEIYNVTRSSGIMNIGGEVARRDDFLNPSVVETKIGRVMDSSRLFFNEGERLPRTTAFISSFMRWREANPTKKVNSDVIAELLDRADTLTNNQTRASSNPLYQTGLPSVMTQFTTFQARMTDQLFSGRLTPKQKAKLLLVNSALYGLPAGVAGSYFGAVWPVYDTLRQYALENGYDFNDDTNRLIFDGAGGLLADKIAGRRVNFVSSYGPGGMSFLKDFIVDGDISALFGPSGKVIRDVMKHYEPFTASLMNLFDPEDNPEFPISGENIMDALRGISTVNSFAKFYYAANAQKYMSRNGTPLADLTAYEGALMALTGTIPEEGSDVFLMLNSQEKYKKARQDAEKEAGLHLSRALRAWAQGDMKEGNANATKFRSILLLAGYSQWELGEAMSRLLKKSDNRNLIDKIGPDFVTKGPADQRQQRLEQYQREIEQDYQRRNGGQ